MADLTAESERTGLEIAVIGMACRVPGARNVEELWRNLKEGVESITYLSREELLADGEAPETIDSPHYVPVARMIEDIELFDASFYGCSPREAEILDPQQRLLLDCSWEALESAGYDAETFPGLVGVYAGAKLSGYLASLYSKPHIMQAVGDFQAQIANDKDYVATRISYKLGLGGPSVTVQTACSTSLVAVHLACQGLLSGECDMALAGGISIRVPQRVGHLYREGEILSPDGRCRPFDARAQGTIFGDGLGMVVLRRLEDALADGDLILAVIRGTAVNNDGSVKVGYTAPGADGQMRVLRAAQIASRVDPETITYVEAHGTGTALGDPIEVRALTQAFRAQTGKSGYCALGSIKSNIGHLGAASGVAGLIKTVLALQHRQIPPSLLFEAPNPQIDFASSPFYVNTRLANWETPGGVPRRAGVSAFGIGGTNAHAILEEAPPVEPSRPSRSWQLLPLSARTATALDTATANLLSRFKEGTEEGAVGPAQATGSAEGAHTKEPGRAESTHLAPLADIAYTLQVGRRPMEHRRFLVCRTAAEAVSILETADPAQVVTGFSEANDPPVAFLFSGQGAQYPGMGRGLYREEAVFREEIDRCAEVLAPHLDGTDLRRVMFGGEDEGLLQQTSFTQPALFTIEYALARLWMDWGVRPQAMIGHSIGEYVAACLAGVMELEDALSLVAARGRLMQGLPPGAMLTVPLPEEKVEELLGPQLALAAVNGPDRCVVSGPTEAVEALAERLERSGVACRRLHTSHAFHSAMMEPALGPFLERAAAVRLSAPRIPYLSNVTGGWIREAEATDPSYWAKHLRGTVRFHHGLRELLKDRTRVLLEAGPGQTLVALARQHPDRGPGRVVLPSLRHPKEEHHDLAFLLRSLGQLWVAGVTPDWRRVHAGERRRRVALPTYPFERRRYWIELGGAGLPGMAARPPVLARKQDVADWFYLPYWKPTAPRAPLAAADGAPERWLLFADPGDRGGLGAALAGRLRARGREVAVVAPGERFARTGELSWKVEPGSREDYEALLSDLAASGGLPEAVAHLWNVSDGDPSCERSQELGFYSLLALAQALGKQALDETVRLGVVANGLHRVRGHEELHPGKATLLGPVKVAPQEYPRLACHAIDVELSGSPDDLAELLLGELGAPSAERVVAYRGGVRWAQDFSAVRLEQAIEERLPLRRGGVYLITGGLGGLGLVFAEYLARSFQARLVLAGRSALPPREEWEARLAAADAGEAETARLRKLLELESAGAEVLAASADVADPEAVRGLVRQALGRFGALHGVIHAAGVPGGGVIQLKTRDVAERVLAPKVKGTLALAAALDGLAPDFLLLCSSTIGIFGGFGQVDYCGANCFLDAFAHAQAGRGIGRTLSINWGAWDEVGMAVSSVLAQPRPLTPVPSPIPSLPPGEGGQGGEGPPIHPLLDRCEREADRAVFLTRFSPERHWLLAEHRILGTAAIPGTAWLEMARAAFEHLEGRAAAEVRDVTFLTPVMVPDGEEREVRLRLEKQGDDYAFRVESRDGAGWQEHAWGRVGPLADADLRSHPLAEVQARCGVGEVPAELLAGGDKLVFWGPRWQSLREVRIGDGEGLALLELPEEFGGDLESLPLHPALLDVATALGGGVAGEGSYLPFSYRRLQAKRPLPRRVYSYIRTCDGDGDVAMGGGGETVSLDVALLDEEGRGLVEIERFTMKRVGEAVGRLKRPEMPAETARGEKPAGGHGIAAGGIRPAEGVETLRRLLSQPLGAQVAVSTKDLGELIRQADEGLGSGLAEPLSQGRLQEPRPSHPRPEMRTPYVPPSTDAETRLVEVWQGVLGLEAVGIHDNFFELGGDSVMGIQVAARAAEAGFQVSPEQLFRHQTVAELAAVAASAPVPAAAEAPAAPDSHQIAPIGGVMESRFPLVRLDAATLEQLLAGREVEDVYPLSPLQEGLLFHSLSAPESGMYVEQLSGSLVGPLDRAALEGAWQSAVDRHPALRTSFLWGDLEQPLQVVSPWVRMPIEWEDWRGLDAGAQRERFEEVRRADQEQPFRLSEAPLMRIRIYRTAEEVHRLLWTHHHLVLDGWSSPLLVHEVLATYDLLRRGEAPPARPARPFRDYIRWLQEQDVAAAEAFWRRALAGFSRPTPIGADRPAAEADGPAARRADFARRDVSLPAELAGALEAFARQGQLTLNTVVQGMWALLLGLPGYRASGELDVVFGSSVSNRPPEIPGIETQIGFFINALPVRIRLAPEQPLVGWFRSIQENQRELLRYAHVPLVAIRRWSEVPGDLPLFESVYEFWNFPFRGGDGSSQTLRLEPERYDVATNFPLSLRAVPADGLQLQLTYDGQRFDGETIERMLRTLERALRAAAENPDATLGRIAGILEEEEREQRLARASEITGVAQDKLKRLRRRSAPSPVETVPEPVPEGAGELQEKA